MWFFCSIWYLWGLEHRRWLLHSHVQVSSGASGTARGWPGISLHDPSHGELGLPDSIMVPEKSDIPPGARLPRRRRQKLLVLLMPGLVP